MAIYGCGAVSHIHFTQIQIPTPTQQIQMKPPSQKVYVATLDLSGSVLTEENIKQVVQFAYKNKLFLMADEVRIQPLHCG